MSRIHPLATKTFPWYIRFLFFLQRRKYGQALESARLWAYVPRTFLGLSMFWGALDRKKSPIPSLLRGLLLVRVSQINHCAFCVDLNSARLLSEETMRVKLEQLSQFAESGVFSEKEKAALAYAEAITHTERKVTDTIFVRLKTHFSDREIIELTGLIAFQNCSSKFNNALDIPAQGFCTKKQK